MTSQGDLYLNIFVDDAEILREKSTEECENQREASTGTRNMADESLRTIRVSRCNTLVPSEKDKKPKFRKIVIPYMQGRTQWQVLRGTRGRTVAAQLVGGVRAVDSIVAASSLRDAVDAGARRLVGCVRTVDDAVALLVRGVAPDTVVARHHPLRAT